MYTFLSLTVLRVIGFCCYRILDNLPVALKLTAGSYKSSEMGFPVGRKRLDEVICLLVSS